MQLKRPASPFALFFQEQAKDLKLENPGLNQKDIMKLASDKWKSSASYEQQKYRDIYEDKLSIYKQSVKVLFFGIILIYHIILIIKLA